MDAILMIAWLLAAPAAVKADCAVIRQPRNEVGVRGAETLWVEALRSRDVASLSCLLAPEFVDTAWDRRRHPRAEVLAALPNRPANGLALSDVQASVEGDRAVVRGLNTATKPDGSRLGRVRFEDVFVYRDGGWRAVSAAETLAP